MILTATPLAEPTMFKVVLFTVFMTFLVSIITAKLMNTWKAALVVFLPYIVCLGAIFGAMKYNEYRREKMEERARDRREERRLQEIHKIQKDERGRQSPSSPASPSSPPRGIHRDDGPAMLASPAGLFYLTASISTSKYG